MMPEVRHNRPFGPFPGSGGISRFRLLSLLAMAVVLCGALTGACTPADTAGEMSASEASSAETSSTEASSTEASFAEGSSIAEARVEGATTIIVVRHGERAPGDDDPHLSTEGTARANTLGWMLQDVGVSAIYSTDYNRTRETVGPLAERMGVELRIENVGPVRGEGQGPFLDFARRVVEAHTGETVVVAGHSNTVAAIVTAFGAGDVAPLTEADYDRLFVVTVSPTGVGTLLRLRFGQANPPNLPT